MRLCGREGETREVKKEVGAEKMTVYNKKKDKRRNQAASERCKNISHLQRFTVNPSVARCQQYLLLLIDLVLVGQIFEILSFQ